MDDGPGFLEPWQWAQLDDVLFDSNVRPSSFMQEGVITRRGWFFVSRLPIGQQYALLHHSEYRREVALEIRWASDGDGPEASYVVAMKPRPDGRPRTQGPQLEAGLDWEDVADLVAEWAVVAALDLRARGSYRDVRERARSQWAPFAEGGGGLRELTSETFVGDELPRVLDKALDDAGVHDEDIRRRMRTWADDRSGELLWLVQQRTRESARDFGRLVFDALRRDLATDVARTVRDGIMEAVMFILPW